MNNNLNSALFSSNDRISTKTFTSFKLDYDERGRSLKNILKFELRQDSLNSLIEIIQSNLYYHISEITFVVINQETMSDLNILLYSNITYYSDSNLIYYGKYNGIDFYRHCNKFIFGAPYFS